MNPLQRSPATVNGRAPAIESEEQQLREAAGIARQRFADKKNASQTSVTLRNGRIVLVRLHGLSSIRGFDGKTGLLLFASNPSTPFALAGTGFCPRTMKRAK